MFNFVAINYFNKYTVYFSYPKSWVMWAIIDLHDYMMFFIINIFLVVFIYMCLILFAQQNFFLDINFIKKYVYLNAKDYNDEPLLEFVWTFLPAILLAIMSWPSFTLLYAMEQLIDPFHTVIITGNQWYWTYQYSDFDVISDIIIQLDSNKGIDYIADITTKEYSRAYSDSLPLPHDLNFFDLIQFIGKHARKYENTQLIYDSIIITDDNLPVGYPRLLCTDQVLILPANVSIRLLMTSSDVIHSWALPSHGIKMDAIPGRINQVPFLTPFWGTYWGQCSELCGINHGFMPIEVRVVCLEDYLSFIKLNISYKYDKFVPLVRNLIAAYVLDAAANYKGKN